MLAAPRRLLGLALAVVGLVSQLALGAVALPDAPSAEDQLAAVSVLCAPGRKPAPQPAHHAPLPMQVALALPCAAPAPPAPVPPAPAAALIAREGRAPQPRAPPPAVAIAAQPRGPPVLS